MDLKDPRVISVIAAGSLLALALVTWLLICINKSRRIGKAHRAKLAQAYQARLDQLEALMARALDNDPVACSELCANRYYGDNWQSLANNAVGDLSDRFNEAVDHAERLLNYGHQHAQAAQALADSMRGNTQQRVEGLAAYLKALQGCTHDNAKRIELDHELTAARALELLDMAIKDYYEELLELARNGDDKALIMLDLLITNTHLTDRAQGLGRPFYGLSVIRLERSDDWNNLVARLIPNPQLRLFVPRENIMVGDLLRMAADAERSNDLVAALMVIAYWHTGTRYKQEITDEMITSLIRMVARLRADATQTAN